MAQSFTTRLKLLLDDTLTSSARYNLERIDSLGETFLLTERADVEIRAQNKIILRPNSSEAGGNGSGGQLDISTLLQPLDLLQVYADTVKFSGGSISLENNGFDVSLVAPVLSADISFTLPAADGTSGQILSTDGSGNLSWTTNQAGGQSATFSWAPGDGTIKTISHNFGTQNITVDIYDTVSENKVGINKIEYISNNVIQLTSLEVPESSGYKIYLQEIL